MTSNLTYRRLTAIAATVIIGAYTYSVCADDSSHKEKPSDPDFTGKIVVVIIDQSSAVERRQNTEILDHATMTQIGGRHFIVGNAYSPSDVPANWRTGSQVGVAWEKVHMYYAYTPEQFKNYSKKWSESSDDKEEK
jgi:hypothetical protein